MSRLGVEFREEIGISKSKNAVATLRFTSLRTLMIHAFFGACTARGVWRVSIERGQCARVERQEIGLLGGCRLGACCVHRVCARRTPSFSEAWPSLGEGSGRPTEIEIGEP